MIAAIIVLYHQSVEEVMQRISDGWARWFTSCWWIIRRDYRKD